MKYESDTELIASGKLCDLTGLSDRWHRKLAEQGYFPTPINGMYQKDKAVAGIVRYYRERHSKIARTIAEDKSLKTKREIELLELRIAEESRKLVPVAQVERVWCGITLALRQAILAADIPEAAKEELARTCREIDPEQYFPEADPEGGQRDAGD
jgi:hypothetical protein